MPSLEVSVKGISIPIISYSVEFDITVTHTETMTSPSTTLVLLDMVKFAASRGEHIRISEPSSKYMWQSQVENEH